MGFSMFSAQASPIAIDFGSSSAKLLQISAAGKSGGVPGTPTLVAAAELAIPDSIRNDASKVFDYYSEHLPKLVRDAGFKGRRAVCSAPCHQTHVQHMQLPSTTPQGGGAAGDSTKLVDQVKAQLQIQLGILPDAVVVRPIDVGEYMREGQLRREVICFAIARETVMKYVELLSRCKLDVVGVHGEPLALLRAFDHLHRRATDASTNTLYIDLGWGGTRVAISHGKQLVFARHIQIGGRTFDQLIADARQCDLRAARDFRLERQSGDPSAAGSGFRSAVGASSAVPAPAVASAVATGGSTDSPDPASGGDSSGHASLDMRTGQAPVELRTSIDPAPAQEHGSRKAPPGVDFTELLDSICDELSMSLRYHRSLYPNLPIHRAIFMGGESRQIELCRHIARAIGLPSQLGDPVARLRIGDMHATPGVDLRKPQPGWAVACGLCIAPTDL